jgi:hypothetical protein
MAESDSTTPRTEPRELTAFVVDFRRAKGADFEVGLFIGRHDSDDNGVIFDMDGRQVPAPIWQYSDVHCRGCLIVRDDRA